MQTAHVQLSGETDEAVLREMGQHAVDEGWVDDSYVEALLQREAAYPTGLEIPGEEGTLGIAIPHADADHVAEQAVLVGLPGETATFRSMDDKSREIEVEAVILLVLGEAEGYATFLSNLTDLFQDGAFARHVREKNGDAIVEMVLDAAVHT